MLGPYVFTRIRSMSGDNCFIATCSVCLWCYTCFPKLANQDVWLRQTCYKVKSLLPTPNSVNFPISMRSECCPWFPSVYFSQLSAVYFGNWQRETQRLWSALFQKFSSKENTRNAPGVSAGSVTSFHWLALLIEVRKVFTNQRFCG